MDISIITVTYNSKDMIGEQIRSVVSVCAGLRCEQIVVDNGSTDGTVELLKNYFSQVRVIENKENRGFAAANNQGVKVATGEFVLFLNPDMKFQEGEQMSKWIEWMRAHPDVGISGCTLVDENGKLNVDAMPRRFPRMWELLAIFFKLPHLFPTLLEDYLYCNRDFSKEQEVDSVRGSCMLVRSDLIQKLGKAFDERYFIWFEDVDICRKANKLRCKVMYAPIVSCVDLVGKSFKKKKFFWKQWRFGQSAVQYLWKWNGM